MLRVIFIGILSIQWIIHLMFTYKSLQEFLSLAIKTWVTRLQIILYIVVAIMFVLTIIGYILNKEAWWIIGLVTVVLSQILIMTNWQQAKFATILNVIILGVVITAFYFWSFDRKTENKVIDLYDNIAIRDLTITIDMISELPEPVKRWMIHSQTVGSKAVETVHLKQRGMMRLTPEQETWNETEAVQYFSVTKPEFIWQVKTNMNGLPVIGRDVFKDGNGSMVIKLAGMIPVVNVSEHEKINISTLQRYLGEIIWFPSAALSPYITWEEIDDNHAKAIMTYMGTTGSATFEFDEVGNVIEFTAQRYKDINDEHTTLWIAKIIESKEISGIIMPSKCEISWQNDDGLFTWYKFEIYDVRYNESIKLLLNS